MLQVKISLEYWEPGPGKLKSGTAVTAGLRDWWETKADTYCITVSPTHHGLIPSSCAYSRQVRRDPRILSAHGELVGFPGD